MIGQLDTRIPLAIEQPNLLGAMAQGTQNAANQAALMRQAEAQNLFRQYGAGAMQGDQNALAMIAGFDPGVAQDLQAGRLDMDATRLDMTLTNEQIAQVRQNMAAAVRAEKDAAALAAQKAELDAAARAAATAWARGDKIGWQKATSVIEDGGLPMDEMGLELLDGIVTGFEDGYAGLAATKPGFRDATPEEAAKYGAVGGQFGPDGRFYPINPPSGFEIVRNADGSETIRQGAGVGKGGSAVPGTVGVGQTFNPGDVNTALGLITDIFNSPDLPRITGPLAGGGGNDVEQLNVLQRAYYGSGGLATIEKIAQLQGQAWLAARDMLKGGGPITDYESRKAEQAVVRLSRVKDEREYQAALKDLHDAIREGMIKLRDAEQLPAGVQIPEPLGATTEPTAQGAVTPGRGRGGRQDGANTTASGVTWSIEE